MLKPELAITETRLASAGEIRLILLRDGLASLVAADLEEPDLVGMAWAGDALHIEIMRDQLRAQGASTDTIALYAGDGTPVSKGFVSHDLEAEKSIISQLATHPELQSLGLGTLLLEVMETRIRARGIPKAILGVEISNPRARNLYERLGYEHFATAVDSWEATDETGQAYTHETDVAWLVKPL